MRRKYLLFSIIILLPGSLRSQEPDSLRKGIHQEDNEYYSTIFKPQPENKSPGYPVDLSQIPEKISDRMIFGWHPYWASSTAHINYNFDLLTHIAWFSYEVDTATGGYTSIHDWNTTPLINYAHQRGTKVVLTVTNFGDTRNTEILTDTIKQKYLITTLVSLLKSRNGDGVNFDFESVGSSQRQNLVDFIERAVTSIKQELPEAEISMAIPAVNWNDSFDLKALSALLDYVQVMTYNYYWSTSPTAGPVAPVSGEIYNVTRTINTYLAEGLLKDKFLLGIPWYGLDWPVISSARKATSTGKATAKTFSSAQQLAESHSPRFDEVTGVPWISYTSPSSWRQMWFEDSVSLLYKYRLVSSNDLAGVGIWALSYEGNYSEPWNSIKSAFFIRATDKNSIINIFPNPVSEEADIRFYLTGKSRVTLILYDMHGKEISVLLNRELEAGAHTFEFSSAGLSQGIYICVLRTGKDLSAGKIVIAGR